MAGRPMCDDTPPVNGDGAVRDALSIAEDVDKRHRAVLVLLVQLRHPDESRLFLRDGREDEIVFRLNVR